MSTFKRKQNLFSEGAPFFGVYIICQGKVMVFKSLDNDKKQITRFATSGDILWYGSDKHKTYPINAVALADSQVCFINNEFFIKLLSGCSELSVNLVQQYSNELCKAETRMKAFRQMNVHQRTADAILQLNNAFGVRRNEKSLIDVGITRKDLADLAGTSPERASISMTKLKMENLVETDGKTIIINDTRKLEEMVGCYDSCCVD